MKELVDTLRGAKTIAIVSHRDPDPDTIGSGIALGLALDSLGKRVTLHCADAVPEHARFLTWADSYTTEPPPATSDLIVTVDFGSAERAKFALPAGPTLVNIDHHASNDNFGSVNLVDVSSAATLEDTITNRPKTAATQNRCIAILLSISPADRTEGSHMCAL